MRSGHATSRRRVLDPHREPLPTRVEDLAPLPADYDAALEAGLAELGITLDPTARERIDGHVRLLLAWNAAINLTAIREPAEVARLHVVDSLAGVAVLRERGIDAFVDLGSGGGFPGLPLAAALPARRALLVDSVGKKAAFLAVAAEAVGLAPAVAAVASRAEELAGRPAHRERWPAVTARAVAPLAELLELGFPLLRPGGIVLAWKRGVLEPEWDAALRALRGLGGGRLARVPVDAAGLQGHVLVVATKGGRTGAAYPRPPAARRRRPW